jgi:hypothetical protein
MTVTPESIYQLLKSYEGKFTPPAPYFSITVGTLDVDTGAFAGLVTTSVTDPEPVEHGPHDTPHSPPPHFVGLEWVSVTIDSHWKRTTTKTPAPKVPVQPVLLVFSVSRPVAGGWGVSVNGETVQADPGSTSLSVGIWDSASASWTINAGAASHSDNLRLQRAPGVLGGALGGFTIPVLPVTIVYAPPADSLQKSVATYTDGQTVGQTLTFDSSSDTSRQVPTSAVDLTTFKSALDLAAGKLGALADPTGLALVESGLFSGISSQIGQVSSSETTGITEGTDEQMTVTTTTSTAFATSAANGGPGVGDTIYFLHNVLMAWAYYEGQLRLTPLGAHNAAFPVSALQQQAATIGLSPGDAESLMALDPFVAGGPSTDLPTDRFQQRDTWEYGFGGSVHLTDTVTRDTKTTVTTGSYATASSEWDAGPILTVLGFGEKDVTTTKVSNATGTDVSSTITLDAVLTAGPNDYFVVTLWYDALFGTFAFQSNPPAPAPRLKGNGAKPGQSVKLVIGGRVFTTVADKHGAYRFFARNIPAGHGMLTIGHGPAKPVKVAGKAS